MFGLILNAKNFGFWICILDFSCCFFSPQTFQTSHPFLHLDKNRDSFCINADLFSSKFSYRCHNSSSLCMGLLHIKKRTCFPTLCIFAWCPFHPHLPVKVTCSWFVVCGLLYTRGIYNNWKYLECVLTQRQRKQVISSWQII